MQSVLIGQRLAASCALGWILFNNPLLASFNDAGFLLGIPSLYAYLFSAWALLICLMAFLAQEKHPRERNDPPAKD